MRRLELVRIRVCTRCGRGGAELKSEDGATLVVRLEAARAAELRSERRGDEMRWLTDVVLANLGSAGLAVREVVLDVADGAMRAFLTLGRDGRTTEPEVVACTPEEAVALAVRGGHRLFATDQALAAPRGRGEPRDEGGTGGSGTLH